MSSRCLEIGLCVFLCASLCACEREERRFSDAYPGDATTNSISQSDLQPGPATAAATSKSPYDDNAQAISQGKQFYETFNCNGCHANGGGAIGPPLMDETWIYGGSAENIFATIVEGRPNGMPSFRGRIPPQQVWQIVAYVRSMSGQVSKDVAASRSDHLFMKKSEQSTAVVRAGPEPGPPQPPGE